MPRAGMAESTYRRPCAGHLVITPVVAALLPDLHRMQEVPEGEGDDHHYGGGDARAKGEDSALSRTCGHNGLPPSTLLLPRGRRGGFHPDLLRVRCRHPRTEVLPLPSTSGAFSVGCGEVRSEGGDCGCCRGAPESRAGYPEVERLVRVTRLPPAERSSPTPPRRSHRGWPGTTADFDPLPFDADAARAFGRVAASLRRSGWKTSARAYDAMIAAIAIANSLPLYTCNPEDFRGDRWPDRGCCRSSGCSIRSGLTRGEPRTRRWTQGRRSAGARYVVRRIIPMLTWLR
jgi:hypothetical protein